MTRSDYLISRRIKGTSVSKLLEDIESAEIDSSSIIKYLREDLRMLGINTSVSLSESVVGVSCAKLSSGSVISLLAVLDTYAQVYPELKFLINDK